LATSLRAVGFEIGFLAPAAHPVDAESHTFTRVVLNSLRPSRSLEKAIGLLKPDIVIPADEVMVLLLHQLHRTRPGLRELIERSLGAPESFGITLSRVALADIARQEQIETPPSARVRSERDLADWALPARLPAFVKADGTWGGAGVIRAETLGECLRAYRRLRGFYALPRIVWRLANRDVTRLPLRSAGFEVSIQSEAAGVPANCAVAAWRGEMVACIAAVAIRTNGSTGASTVIRLLGNHPTRDICRLLVRRLGLSGLVGFDFIIDQATGRPFLIELNARATQTSYLRLGEGSDPAEALRAAVMGEPARATPPMSESDIIELFPQGRLKNGEAQSNDSMDDPEFGPAEFSSAAQNLSSGI
jgi:hypothetical protein